MAVLDDDAAGQGTRPDPSLAEIDRLRRAVDVRRLLALRERPSATKISAACEVALIMLSGTPAFAEAAKLAKIDHSSCARVRAWGWPFSDADSATARLALELAERQLDLPIEAFDRVRDEPTDTADVRLLYLVGAVRAAHGAALPWFVAYGVANSPTVVLRSIWSKASSPGWCAWGWWVHKLGWLVVFLFAAIAVLVSAWALLAYVASCVVGASLGLEPVRAGIWACLAACAALDQVEDASSHDARSTLIAIVSGFVAPVSIVGHALYFKIEASFALPVWSRRCASVVLAMFAVTVTATMPVDARLGAAAGCAIAILHLKGLISIFELIPGATPPIVANALTLRLLEQLRSRV